MRLGGRRPAPLIFAARDHLHGVSRPNLVVAAKISA